MAALEGMNSILASSAAFSTLNHRTEMLLSDPQIQQAELVRLSDMLNEKEQRIEQSQVEIERLRQQVAFQQERISAQESAKDVLSAKLSDSLDLVKEMNPLLEALEQAYSCIRVLSADKHLCEQEGNEFSKSALESATLTSKLLEINEKQASLIQTEQAQLFSMEEIVTTYKQLILQQQENWIYIEEFTDSNQMYDYSLPEIECEEVKEAALKLAKISSILESENAKNQDEQLKTLSSVNKYIQNKNRSFVKAVNLLKIPSFEQKTNIEQLVSSIKDRIERVNEEFEKYEIYKAQREKEYKLFESERDEEVEQLRQVVVDESKLLQLKDRKLNAYQELQNTIQESMLRESQLLECE